MPQTLDARGLLCPLPAVLTRARLARLPPEEEFIVLATDPEAPIDLAAAAADHGRTSRVERHGDVWRIVLGPAAALTR
jgi:tRNA 2-thiouridine synthesizing protein A